MAGYTRFLYFTNNVVQVYDTAPGVDPRVSEVVLGTGGTTYICSGSHFATYNFSDDKVYVFCQKNGSVDTVIVFDPRDMVIVRETSGSFVDVQGDTIWAFDGSDLIALDTVTLAEVFRTPYGDENFRFQQAIPDRRALMYGIDSTLYVITITGATTYSSSTPITLLDPGPGWLEDEDAVYARPYCPTGNKMWIRADVYGGAGGTLGGIFDIDANAITYVNNPPGYSLGGDNHPYYDLASNRIYIQKYSEVDDLFGVLGWTIYMATGAVEGPYGGSVGSFEEGPLDWNEGVRLICGGSFLTKNYTNTNLGRFLAGSAASTVASEILTSSTMTTPIGGLFPDMGAVTSSGLVSIPGADVPPEPPVVPPKMETSVGGGGGNCGIQFEHLEMFHLLKSLMGGGYTLREALNFLDQSDIDFIEEEDLMDDLPLEIPKAARQGGSPRMMSSRVDLTPVAKLNSLIEEFEIKLKNCTKGRLQ